MCWIIFSFYLYIRQQSFSNHSIRWGSWIACTSARDRTRAMIRRLENSIAQSSTYFRFAWRIFLYFFDSHLLSIHRGWMMSVPRAYIYDRVRIRLSPITSRSGILPWKIWKIYILFICSRKVRECLCFLFEVSTFHVFFYKYKGQRRNTITKCTWSIVKKKRARGFLSIQLWSTHGKCCSAFYINRNCFKPHLTTVLSSVERASLWKVIITEVGGRSCLHCFILHL